MLLYSCSRTKYSILAPNRHRLGKSRGRTRLKVLDAISFCRHTVIFLRSSSDCAFRHVALWPVFRCTGFERWRPLLWSQRKRKLRTASKAEDQYFCAVWRNGAERGDEELTVWKYGHDYCQFLVLTVWYINHNAGAFGRPFLRNQLKPGRLTTTCAGRAFCRVRSEQRTAA